MNANEAPEKIILSADKDTKIIHDEWVVKDLTDDIKIEYTRSDAFIEKALKFLDGCIPEYVDLKHANVDTFMNVDNKRFIEDFRKYMEGK